MRKGSRGSATWIIWLHSIWSHLDLELSLLVPRKSATFSLSLYHLLPVHQMASTNVRVSTPPSRYSPSSPRPHSYPFAPARFNAQRQTKMQPVDTLASHPVSSLQARLVSHPRSSSGPRRPSRGRSSARLSLTKRCAYPSI